MLTFTPRELSIIPNVAHDGKPRSVRVRNNLYFLAKHLLTARPEKFSMSDYFESSSLGGPLPEHYTTMPCGTSACAAGHTFAAGVAKVEDWRNADGLIKWGLICHDLYGTALLEHDWDFLFAPYWERVAPRSPVFAAWKICYHLLFGSPHLDFVEVRNHYYSRAH